ETTPHVLPVTAKGGEVVAEVTVIEALPVLVTVMISVVETAPTGTLPKEITAGLRVNTGAGGGGAPGAMEPETGSVCGLPAALL
ncbi:MAG TPA: hypothetical protein PLD37_12575, partial [Usitatibacteraceae bacterium]|nr:hypothetical protein [Usitatibacteraceae bacterium]